MTVGAFFMSGLDRMKLRLRPCDMSTPDGRASERHRRAALTAVAAVVAKCLSVATALITVPLTLHYLGPERYGMWMTISSLVAMLSFADLGIGNGIVNAVSTASGEEDYAAVKEYVSSGVFILSVIALFLLAIFAACYSVVPWHQVFNVSSVQAKQDAGPSVAVLIVCFTIAIPLGLIQRLQMGLQKGFIANIWQCLSSLIALGCVVLAISFKAGLPWLVLAFAGSPLIASLFNSVLYFGWLQPEYAPAIRCISRSAIRRIAHVGILFFVMQVASAIIYSSDNIVIAQLLGASAVAVYAVPQRLFSTIPMVLSMFLSPLWPAYGEAIARGDDEWVKRTLMRSFLICIGFAGVLSAVLVAFGVPIMRLWIGDVIEPSLMLLLGLGVWQVIQVTGYAAAMFLNGANVVRFQVVVATVTCVVSISLKLVLVDRVGVSGAVWSTVIAYMVCAALPIYWKISYMMSQGVHGRRLI